MGWVILKGTFGELKSRGIEQWVEEMANHVSPDSAAHLRENLNVIRKPFLLSAASQCAEKWSKPGVLLIGDAAHATSPYAGMGACATIADCRCLAELTDDCTDITEMFQRFQDDRKPITDGIIKHSRDSLHMSSGRSKLKNWFRDLKMQHIPDKQMHKIVADMVNGN